MSKQTEALKLAREALEYISSHYMSLPKIGCMALAAVEEALAEQPAQCKPWQTLTDEQPVSEADELPNGFVPLQKENGKLVYAACMDSSASHYKWLMWRHPDGQWVSKRKLEDWEVMQVEDQEHYGIVQEAAHGITGEQK